MLPKTLEQEESRDKVSLVMYTHTLPWMRQPSLAPDYSTPHLILTIHHLARDAPFPSIYGGGKRLLYF